METQFLDPDPRHNERHSTLHGADQVTAVVLNYNGIRILDDCIESIRKLDVPVDEIILVDDGSTDGSTDWVRKHHADVRVVEMETNTKRLNKVRNTGLTTARNDLVLIVDNDVSLKSDCLEELLMALGSLPQAAVCMPRATYDTNHDQIYQDGQILHYVGASQALNRNKSTAESEGPPRLSIGWGVQLIDRREATKIGLFEEAYVMGWGDDGEFNHKMNLCGHRCYHVPQAVVYHKRVVPAGRYYGSARNRWRFMLETYQARTLVLCAPAILLYEVTLLGFMTLKGAGIEYFRAMRDLIPELSSIWAVRRRIQGLRTTRDVELMAGDSIFVPSDYATHAAVRAMANLVNGILSTYWKMVRGLL